MIENLKMVELAEDFLKCLEFRTAQGEVSWKSSED